MSIAVRFDLPDDTLTQYDEAFRLGGETLFNQPDRRFHVCYETATGFNVLDVWESGRPSPHSARSWDRFSPRRALRRSRRSTGCTRPSRPGATEADDATMRQMSIEYYGARRRIPRAIIQPNTIPPGAQTATLRGQWPRRYAARQPIESVKVVPTTIETSTQWESIHALRLLCASVSGRGRATPMLAHHAEGARSRKIPMPTYPAPAIQAWSSSFRTPSDNSSEPSTKPTRR